MQKIIVLIVIILIIGFLWLKGKETEAPMSDPPYLPSPTATNPDSTTEGIITTAPAPAEAIKEFTVIGANFSFTPKTIEVNQGDTVRITFKAADNFHDLKLDEFSLATKQLKAGESETVQFVAGKTGSFEYYCSIDNHRAIGMKGLLTVK